MPPRLKLMSTNNTGLKAEIYKQTMCNVQTDIHNPYRRQALCDVHTHTHTHTHTTHH